MNETFHDSARLGHDELRSLALRSDAPGLARFGVQFALLLASGALVARGPAAAGAWAWGAAVLVFALLTMAMFAVVHETGHHTAFRSIGLNRAVNWLAALAIFYVPTGFREFHFAHHRATHEPGRDPEISVAAKPAPAVTSNLALYLGFLSGVPLLLYKIALLLAAASNLRAAWSGFLYYVPERSRRRLAWEARAALAAYAAIAAAGLLWLPGLAYLLAAEWIGHAMLAAYITAEHGGLPHQGDIFARTREIRTAAPLNWLMWNMPYHAAHHAYPAVPFHALPTLDARLGAEIRVRQPGYLRFHARVVASLLRGKPFAESPR